MRHFLKVLFFMTPAPLLFLISCSHGHDLTMITSVHDGDTFTTSSGTKIRLFGVDTPEISNQFDGFAQTEGIEQLYALQAKEEAEKIILGREVKMQIMSKDKYSREVAKVEIGGVDLALDLISKGLARVAYFNVINPKDMYYSTMFDYYNQLVWAQFQAFEKHLGVWTDHDNFKAIFPKAI